MKDFCKSASPLYFSLERIAFTVPACHFCLPLGDSVRRCAFHKHPVDPLYKFGLFFIDYQFTVGSSVVAKEPFEWNGNLAVSKTFSLTPGAVLGNASGFFLRQRGHDCDEKFSLPIKGPDVFFQNSTRRYAPSAHGW